MPETTPLIKAALNLRGGAGFDVYFLFNKSLAFTQMHNKYFYCFNLNYITRYENKKDDTIQTINLYRIVFLPIIILSSSLPMM